MAEINLYSDIDLRWYPHPLTGNVVPKYNIDAIKQSISNLFLIDAYDIPFDANAYCNLKKYLFEPITIISALNLEVRVEWMIKRFETRVLLRKTKVIPLDTEDGFDITLTYKIKAFNIEDTTTYYFQRVR